MALKIPVKAGAISNLTDARFFAAFGVDMLGFCFDPQSENYISPQEALAIKAWISGPQIVAEFKNQDAENVRNIIAFLQPDIVQLDAEYSRIFQADLEQEDLPVIRDFSQGAFTADLISNSCTPLTTFLLLTAAQYNAIKDNVAYACMIVCISGEMIADFPAIQLQGAPEKNTGIKSFDFESEVLEQLSAES